MTLLELLKRLEWCGNEIYYGGEFTWQCPECDSDEGEHTETCELKAAIDKLESEKPTNTDEGEK